SNNLNGNNTDKEQNIESSEGLDVLKDESLKTMLKKNRNEENQQEVQNNMILQTEISMDLHQDRPGDQLDPKKVNQQAQKCTVSISINILNIDYEYVQIQVKESNIEEQLLIRAKSYIKAPESSIQKLNRKINVLEKKVARNKELADLQLVIERLKRNLQDKFMNLTSYNVAEIDKIKIPNKEGVLNSIEVLHYIKDYYSYMHQPEPIKIDAIDRITNDLPQIEELNNQNLT
ncbi:32172_t:CDS:2, partial [Gigaspora margarita]